MSKVNNLTDFLTDVADAIRYSADKTGIINPQTFSDEIRKLKFSAISVSLVSNTEISGDALDNVKSKQRYLTAAINGTVIDGEDVYKITQQINDDNSSTDTIFYTKEGDAGNYYYVLSSIDNFLNKVVSYKKFSLEIDGTIYGPYNFIQGDTFEDIRRRIAAGDTTIDSYDGLCSCTGGFGVYDSGGCGDINGMDQDAIIEEKTYTGLSIGGWEPL